jgi:MFS family permease
VIFALNDLDLNAGHLGLAMGIGSAGGLVGALVAPRVTRWVGEGRVIPLSALLMWPAEFLMPLAGTVILPMVAITGYMLIETFSVVLYNVTQVSFRQRLCPRPLLGRMNASIRFLVWGVMPIGGLIGGLLGQALGARQVFWIGAFGAIAATLPVLVSPLIRMRDMPRELDKLS